VGIAARLAYTPHIRHAQGGKVWLEFLDETQEWKTWVPSMAQDSPQAEHHRMLSEALTDQCGIIFAHPADPAEITESYVPVYEFKFTVDEDSETREQYNLAFFSGGYLRPIRGMELMSIRTAVPKRTIGSQQFWTFVVQDDIAVAGELHTNE
jgi:hypothetical protein